MSMQNEGEDVKGSSAPESPRSGKENAGITGDTDAAGVPGATEGSQQAEMPPSETDDDQYDQGTVKRAR
jgi:hypothetical protein